MMRDHTYVNLYFFFIDDHRRFVWKRRFVDFLMADLRASWSILGYLLGLIILLGAIALPLTAMGLRSRSIFRRSKLMQPAPFH